MKKINLCEYCGKGGKNHTCRNKHEVICEMCENVFASPLILRRHIESVHRAIKYKCNLCGNIFNSMSSMKRHEKRHLEKKEHTCDICQKEFSRKEHLKKHIKSCTAKNLKLFKIHRPSNYNANLSSQPPPSPSPANTPSACCRNKLDPNHRIVTTQFKLSWMALVEVNKVKLSILNKVHFIIHHFSTYFEDPISGDEGLGTSTDQIIENIHSYIDRAFRKSR